MTTLLLERSLARDEGFEHGAHPRLDDARFAGRADAHGRLTLDELIIDVWEGLAVRASVNCPVCAGQMALRSVADSEDSPTGVCADCGSRLS
jgi:hypothetical protein